MDNQTNVLIEKVKALKLIARNALRMELISPILAEIGRLEKEIKTINEHAADQEKRAAIATYKIARLERLDADHPDFNNLKKEQEEKFENTKKAYQNLINEKELYTKRIEEEKTAIAKIETGETLVNAEDLANMVNKLILQDAKNTIATS